MLAAGAPPVFAPPRRGDEPQAGPAGLRLPLAEPKRGDANGEAPRVSDDADFLIEPGSGFKPGRGERETKPTSPELAGGAPSQANFIAAARRAVAAAQAAGSEVQAHNRQNRVAKSSAGKTGVLSRFADARAALNSHKRPILLGLAGLLLLIGAYEVLRMGGDTNVPSPKAKIEAPADPKPRSEAANPGPKPDTSHTDPDFATSNPAQPRSVPAARPPAKLRRYQSANTAVKADPTPTNTIAQPPAMIGNNAAQAKTASPVCRVSR